MTSPQMPRRQAEAPSTAASMPDRTAPMQSLDISHEMQYPRQSDWWLAIVCGAVGWLIVCLAGNLAMAQDSEDDLLRDMCTGGLVQTALGYVDAQLRELEHSSESRTVAIDDLQARWTMRKMECMALGASRDAPSMWDAIPSIYDDFLANHPNNRRLPWIRWQLLRCNLLRAQATFAEYLAAPGQSQLRDVTLERIRELQRQADELLAEIQQRQPIAARLPLDSPEQAPADQLSQLRSDTQLVQCEAMLIRAQLYPPDSADRIAAATAVDQLASATLQQADENWSARPALQVAQNIARLSLGDADRALLELVELLRTYAKEPVGQRAGQAAVEYLIDNDELSRAAAIVELMQQTGKGPEPVLAELHLRLAELSRKSSEHSSQQELDAVIALVKTIGERFGDYWRNRAEAMLLTDIKGQLPSGAPVSMDLIKAEVRQLLAASDEQAAVQRLTRAADQFADSGEPENALEMASLAAALMERQGQWLAAAETLESYATRLHETTGAAELHVRAIVAVAQALRIGEPTEELLRRYENLLVQQMEKWADAPASDRVQQWLRDWMQRHGKHRQYCNIVFQRAVACGETETQTRLLLDWAAALLELPQEDVQPALDDARQQLDAASNGSARSSPQDAWMAVDTIARWGDPIESRSRRGDLLLRLNTAKPGEISTLLRAAMALEVTRFDNLADAIRQSSEYEPDLLPTTMHQAMLRFWGEAIDQRPPRERSHWASATKLKAPQPPDDTDATPAARQVWNWRAVAWLQPERLAEASEQIREIASAHPRDGWIQLSRVGILIEQPEPAWDQAMGLVKRVIAGSKSGSPLDFEARWKWVSVLIWSGKTEQASSYARLVMASYPNIPPKWRYRFHQAAAGEP